MVAIPLKQIRGMTVEQKNSKINELRLELMKLRTTVKAGGKVENPGRIRLLRRTIAQILTVQNEERARSDKEL